MSKAALTDFTGAEIYPGRLITFSTRRGNRVRVTEAIVLETLTDRSSGRVVPKLRVRPTGRESGISARKTTDIRTIGAEHVVVISDAPTA
ncbi:hypothetical protein [Streptomyces fulvorobeus]|uniref:Uncharacterized protein n=1 Tax=Streptomyces fulvorobeus TaxID=284028 RepID=A0A7J0CE23_9ACTN|nr:hypothetical protein [Streptomyces fulvorobeus]NYE44234.1 hypothetical protein [Streptomyces fulvorobeus]GFN00750.1 hypothetical protein Sfulv_55600 [Streptomyces fulvorobeus]